MTVSIVRKAFFTIRNSSFSFNSYTKRKMSGSSSGVHLDTVIKCFKEFAPLSLSEKWDNTGVLIQSSTPRLVNKILLTNDLTEDVLTEAIQKETELIVSYHPPIFSGLKSLTQTTWKERIVVSCIEQRIAVYSPHTSWDAVTEGVNDWLTGCLPEHTRKPISEGPLPNMGPGRFCDILNPVPLEQIIKSLKSLIGINHVQLALARNASLTSEVRSVALCAGSGSSLLNGIKADLYLTGEMGHHDVLNAVHNGTSVILTNHSNSERGFLSVFAPKLENLLEKKVNVIVSTEDRDPLEVV